MNDKPLAGVVVRRALTEGAKSVAIDEDYDAYNYSNRFGRWGYEDQECELYDEYIRQIKSNPFVSLVVFFIQNEVFANGTGFVGPDAEKINGWYKEKNGEAKLRDCCFDVLSLGNGYLSLTADGNKRLKDFVAIDGASVRIDWKDLRKPYVDSNKKYYQPAFYINQKDDNVLNREMLAHLTIRKLGGHRYGMSILRPNLDFFRSLRDVGRDIPAALKRVAFAPILASLDLSQYATKDEKETALEDFAELLEEVHSATYNYVIDNKNKMELLGTGSTGARLLPINDLIEPIITVVLLNCGFPPGFFLQGGANRSIVDAQYSATGPFVNHVRGYIKSVVDTRIVPLLGADVEFVFKTPDIVNPVVLRRIAMQEYQLGIISREEYLKRFGIEDAGKDFIEIPQKMPFPSANQDEEADYQ